MSSAPGKRRRAALILALAAAAAGLALVVHQLGQPPAPARPRYVLINETGVHDYDLALRMSLKLAEEKSSIENALVLLAELPPARTIEETATEMFTRLRIGARDNGRGILYLYSARENLMRIEVSYDLEAVLPDLYCHKVEEAARAYMLSEVPQDFLSELIITTNLRGMASRTDALAPVPPGWLSGGFLSGGGGALLHGYRRTLADLQRAIGALPKAQLERYAPAADPDTAVQRYLESLAAGVGDPNLPLLTEGSRVFRAVVPRDAAQQRRIYEYFEAALPYRLMTRADLAIAVPRPGHSNLPVVLRRGSDGRWYVDEAKSWTWFHRFENSVDFFVKYADNPFLAELRAGGWPNMGEAIYGTHVGAPAPPAYPYALAVAVEALEARIRERPDEAARYAALGDLYLFEIDWLTRAIEMYERASRLAPDELAYHWRLADLYLNDSRADRFLEELRTLAARLPQDRALQARYQAYARAYDFGPP